MLSLKSILKIPKKVYTKKANPKTIIKMNKVKKNNNKKNKNKN